MNRTSKKGIQEMTNKNQTPPTLAAVQPVDVVAAHELRAALVDFNRDASTRCKLTPDDLSQLDNLGALAKGYLYAARSAWHEHDEGDNGPHDVPTVANSIPARVTSYLTTNTSTMQIDLSNSRKITASALESAAVRSSVASTGDSIIAQIDAVIAAAGVRIAARDEARRVLANAVSYWMRHDVVRALLIAFVAFVDCEEFRNAATGAASGLLDTLQGVQNIHRGSHPDAPTPLYSVAGAWARWLPMVREQDGSKKERAA
jgi:hypothetical protein